MKAVRNIFRILVGGVFIFSGFVKGVDPLGTVYRMNDYFTAFGIPWASSMSLVLTIFLCTLEFVLGISLLFNLHIKWTAWVLLPVMAYFTVLTLFDALYNIVPDCGCFGDAVKLTNIQTFIKNLILLGMVIPIFAWRKKYKGPARGWVQVLILILFSGGFAAMSVHAYRHLPLIDFMAWKVGNRVNQTSSQPVKFYVTYRNTTTGETREYQAPNYPWNDSVWMANWEFVSQRAADEGTAGTMTLQIEDSTGQDNTAAILGTAGIHFIGVAYDLAEADPVGLKAIDVLYRITREEDYSFVLLTSTLPEDVAAISKKRNLQIPIYYADDVVLKTMVRANPGLILLRSDTVVKKWAWRDLEGYDPIFNEYIRK